MGDQAISYPNVPDTVSNLALAWLILVFPSLQFSSYRWLSNGKIRWICTLDCLCSSLSWWNTAHLHRSKTGWLWRWQSVECGILEPCTFQHQSILTSDITVQTCLWGNPGFLILTTIMLFGIQTPVKPFRRALMKWLHRHFKRWEKLLIKRQGLRDWGDITVRTNPASLPLSSNRRDLRMGDGWVDKCFGVIFSAQNAINYNWNLSMQIH